MSDGRLGMRDARRLEQHADPFPVAGVLAAVALAALLRYGLFIGYQGHDDRTYIAYGWSFAHGGDIAALQLADPWVGRLGAWLPISAAIQVFGVAEWALVLHSWIASLASVVLAAWLGHRFFGARAAVVAAALLAVLPIDVGYGTRAFGDEAAGFWCVAALAALLAMAESGRARWAALAGLAWGVAYVTKETAVLMAVPFALIMVTAGTFAPRPLAALGAGFAAIVLLELIFWAAATGDPLYRWHATLGARSAFIPPPSGAHSWMDWIPRPIPSEVFRSQNSVLDAVLMFLTKQEWGLLFYLVPLAVIWAVRRGPAAARWLAIFICCMALLLAFFPLHFPTYTLGRDPRHFTQLAIPAVVLCSAWLVGLSPRWRAGALALLVATWVPCLYVTVMGSDVSTQRAFASYLKSNTGERVWMNNIVAADAIVLSGFSPSLRLGIIPPVTDLRKIRAGSGFSGAVHALRQDLPVAQGVGALAGQLVAVTNDVIVPPAWPVVRTFHPRDTALSQAVNGLLVAAGVPSHFIDKMSASHGESIRLVRVPADVLAGS